MRLPVLRCRAASRSRRVRTPAPSDFRQQAFPCGGSPVCLRGLRPDAEERRSGVARGDQRDLPGLRNVLPVGRYGSAGVRCRQRPSDGTLRSTVAPPARFGALARIGQAARRRRRRRRHDRRVFHGFPGMAALRSRPGRAQGSGAAPDPALRTPLHRPGRRTRRAVRSHHADPFARAFPRAAGDAEDVAAAPLARRPAVRRGQQRRAHRVRPGRRRPPVPLRPGFPVRAARACGIRDRAGHRPVDQQGNFPARRRSFGGAGRREAAAQAGRGRSRGRRRMARTHVRRRARRSEPRALRHLRHLGRRDLARFGARRPGGVLRRRGSGAAGTAAPGAAGAFTGASAGGRGGVSRLRETGGGNHPPSPRGLAGQVRATGMSGPAYCAVYDFELMPYALGDVLTWNVQTAIRCEELGRERVDILICLDERYPAGIYQRGLVTAENCGLFFNELFGAFGTHPRPGNILVYRRREDVLNHLGGIARQDPAAAEMLADYERALAARDDEDALVGYFTKYIHSHERINAFAKAHRRIPLLLPSTGTEPDIRGLLTRRFADKRVVAIHMRMRRLDAGYGGERTYARDSDFLEWYEFLKSAEQAHPDVQFGALGRLAEKPLELLKLPNVTSVRVFGLGLGHELTLTVHSDLFIGTSSGFAAMANFSTVPYFVTHMTAASCKAYEIEHGAQRF